MNRRLKIVLFADSVVGAAISSSLVRHGGDVVAIVLKVGVSDKIRDDIISPWGQRRVSVYYWQSAENNNEVIEQLRKCGPELGILAWWPYLISDPVIELASVGFLNTHPSFLPYGRGKDPSFWSIVEQTPYGVTLHWVNARIDSGPIAYQREIKVEWENSGGDLYERALRCIVDLFEEKASEIVSGNIPSYPQEEMGTFHYRRELEPASVIQLDEPTTARELLNLLRARTFPPHPACNFTDGEERFEVRISINKIENE